MNAIVIAPFSNSAIRDWPARHFVALVELLLQGEVTAGCPIRIIGTASQRARAAAIVRPYPTDRVVNECGRLSWPQVITTLRSAACIIGNNSGIAHLGGYYGVPTICIFGGSHQRLEWRPLGFNVVLLSRSIGCSPCHLDHGSRCPYGLACLQEISPAEVAAAVSSAIGAARKGRQSSPDDSLDRPSARRGSIA